MSKQHLSPVWARAFDIDVERGEGIYLFDKQGTRYMDFTSGIGVTNTGHAHPRIVRAIQEQAARLIHGQIGTVTAEKVLELTDELLTICPPPLDTFFFSNSGAEAVEAAVKLAKQATGRTNVITFEGSFHGRTHLAMAMTQSKTSYRLKYQPLPSGIFVAPYAHCYHCPIAKRAMTDAQRAALSGSCPNDGGKCCGYAPEQVRWLLKTQTAPAETAAIIVEPVLGEGGYVVPPASFLQELRAICDEHGVLLIFDEVQTGFGRTGKFFALEHFGVVPDILVMAKGLASGMPLSGIAARRELMEKWTPGSHGGTYGPNVVSAAAAVETIRVMKEECIPENAAARGKQLLAGLRALQKDFPSLGDVRGLGCMVATEFVDAQGNPDKALTKQVVQRCAERNLLLLTCGAYENVIRWIPPLVVTEAQINEALHIFAAALDEVA
ncbi:MAG: aminotransferase class III-fold pyridoxal phosphate-dependent enzyme [Anaerolineae bacterium]|nr:aminotransferase class III-fold pyridoxal phosphate-dependent enzyme [Thermoflexales bacterium]MDW8395021.1 aminotransferase class III-fold pyridoxal phosphate-dependent enzyme [Anaerolineae bacterium]